MAGLVVSRVERLEMAAVRVNSERLCNVRHLQERRG